MRKPMRTMLAAGFLGVAMIGFTLLGCTSRLGPVRAAQTEGGIGRPNLPSIAIERSVECMVEYGAQLPPGRLEFKATLEVNEDRHRKVSIDDLPNTAPDFGACVRNVLRDMPIAEEPFQEGVGTLKYLREHASEGRDSFVNFINVIPGVPIVVSELVLEAEGYTVVLPVTVKVVAKPEQLIDDERIVAKLGQLAMANLGYDEIMTRAEQMGWVMTVLMERAQSAAEKRFIGDMPPPSSAVVEAAFKRVMTRAAPAALLASQADSPVPGPGDAVAVGILAVGLLAVGAISAYEIITAPPTATTTAAPAPAPAAQPNATTPPPPPPPPPPPRRYAGQTCDNKRLDELEAAMKAVCKGIPGDTCSQKSKKEQARARVYPCSLIKARISGLNLCRAARQKVQDVCFKGSPEPGHEQQIDDLNRGITLCETLKGVNCAPGHPMSGL